ncbi:MAG: 3D domain-containing protein [Deltaproteobacteria bacterium]|nr:3D domain-containing protein [Deltaproteobacteria bacterium]
MKTMALVCLLGVGIFCTPRPTMCVTMSIVTVTAYHHCPGSRGITASGKRVQTGMIAVSRDLERNLDLDFGDRVLLHGYGVFQVQDRMASRWRKKVDIYLDTQQKARDFGLRRYVVLVKLV